MKFLVGGGLNINREKQGVVKTLLVTYIQYPWDDPLTVRVGHDRDSHYSKYIDSEP